MRHFFVILELKKTQVLLPVNTYINDIHQNTSRLVLGGRKSSVPVCHLTNVSPVNKLLKSVDVRKYLLLIKLPDWVSRAEEMRGGQRRLARARTSPSWGSQRRDALALDEAAWEASKATREKKCLSFTQRQAVDFQRNSQQGIHLALWKNQVKLSSYLLQVKGKSIPSWFQVALGHYN